MFQTAVFVIGVLFWMWVILLGIKLAIMFLCTRAGQVTTALVIGVFVLLLVRKAAGG